MESGSEASGAVEWSIREGATGGRLTGQQMILDVQSTDDSRDMVHRTVQALVEGHLVGVPSDTTYCIAANALCDSAVRRLSELACPSCSALEGSSGMVLSLRSREAAGDFLTPASALARRLMRRCWPGPLTLVCGIEEARSAVSALPDGVRGPIRWSGGEVAFSVSQHRVLSHIHRYLSAPLILACAGGQAGGVPTTVAGVPPAIQRELPLLLDDGPTRYGGESTVARVRGREWTLLREGVIERAAMNQFVKPVIALVCTGNTCRSPMAETLLRERLRKKLGREDALRVISAGLAAAEGSGAAAQAVEVMGRRGLDLTGHSSRPLDDSVMGVADLVLTMTRGHRAAILAAWPELQDRVFTLRRDGGDIEDPVGMPVEAYESCAAQMDEALGEWVEALGDDFFPKSTSDPG